MTKLYAACALGCLVFSSGTALANGRFPQAGQIAVDPSDASHLVVRTTYGLVQTTDAGLTWRWICEPAAYPTGVDPAVLVTGDGSIVTGSIGISRSADRGCAWARMPAPLKDQFVTDLAIDRASPAHAIASVIPIDQVEGFQGFFAETLDDGATWQKKGDLPEDFRALTVELAPSTSGTAALRVYAAGLGGNPLFGEFARSDDGGATWSIAKLGLNGGTPWVSAVDPQNADLLYLRVDGFPEDRLLVSHDGGGSWADAYVSKGDLLGFALSPDGSRVALGGPDDGLLVAATSDLVFHKVNAVGPSCLTWTASGLYLCADATREAFSVAVTTDEGATLRTLFRGPELEPLACAPTSTTGSACPALWPAVAATLKPDAGAPLDASTGDADASSVPDAGTEISRGGFATRGGCSCVTAEGAGGSSARDVAWLAMACVTLLVGAARLRTQLHPRRSRNRTVVKIAETDGARVLVERDALAPAADDELRGVIVAADEAVDREE
jgi:photosystem II stability/assembly factor-like uncharacterized protein